MMYYQFNSDSDEDDMQKKETRLKLLAMKIGIIIMAVVLVYDVLSFRKTQINKYENYTYKVNAVISDLVPVTYNGEMKMNPVYEYTYEDTTYKVNYNYRFNPDDYSIGDQAEIYIDPIHPQRILDPKSEKMRKRRDYIDIVFLSVAYLLLFIVFLTIFIIINKKALRVLIMVFHGEKHIARIPHHTEAITTVMMIHLIALMKFLFMTNLTIIIKIQIESCIQSERSINGGAYKIIREMLLSLS